MDTNLTNLNMSRHTFDMKSLNSYRLAVLLISFMSLMAHADDNKKFAERPLDGVTIEALETYRNPKPNSLDVGLGVWPLNPYFNGFSVDVGYNWILGKTYAFELRGSYIYTVDKGLVSELADTFGQDPQSVIERPNFLAAADFKYTIAYGKFIFFKDRIRYFRSQLLAGPAFISTNKESLFGGDLGWAIEAYVNEQFSWRLEIRDVIASIGSTTNNLELSVGMGYAF
jgi:outer membrane beta-barrel protein